MAFNYWLKWLGTDQIKGMNFERFAVVSGGTETELKFYDTFFSDGWVFAENEIYQLFGSGFFVRDKTHDKIIQGVNWGGYWFERVGSFATKEEAQEKIIKLFHQIKFWDDLNYSEKHLINLENLKNNWGSEAWTNEVEREVYREKEAEIEAKIKELKEQLAEKGEDLFREEFLKTYPTFSDEYPEWFNLIGDYYAMVKEVKEEQGISISGDKIARVVKKGWKVEKDRREEGFVFINEEGEIRVKFGFGEWEWNALEVSPEEVKWVKEFYEAISWNTLKNPSQVALEIYFIRKETGATLAEAVKAFRNEWILSSEISFGKFFRDPEGEIKFAFNSDKERSWSISDWNLGVLKTCLLYLEGEDFKWSEKTRNYERNPWNPPLEENEQKIFTTGFQFRSNELEVYRAGELLQKIRRAKTLKSFEGEAEGLLWKLETDYRAEKAPLHKVWEIVAFYIPAEEVVKHLKNLKRLAVARERALEKDSQDNPWTLGPDERKLFDDMVPDNLTENLNTVPKINSARRFLTLIRKVIQVESLEKYNDINNDLNFAKLEEFADQQKKLKDFEKKEKTIWDLVNGTVGGKLSQITADLEVVMGWFKFAKKYEITQEADQQAWAKKYATAAEAEKLYLQKP